MEFKQTQAANITLGSTISIGEYEGHVTNAKPGNYRVYTVRQEPDSEETALLYVHEDEVQDVNALLPTVDIDTFCGVDGGTYGLITKLEEHNEDYEWDEHWYNRQEHSDGYVTHTLYGDGQFSVYMNKDHSVFLLDDVDIYMDALLIDHDINTHLEWFGFDDEEIELGYIPLHAYGMETLTRPIDESIRKIDNVVGALAEVEQLARVNEVVNELDDESHLTQE